MKEDIVEKLKEIREDLIVLRNHSNSTDQFKCRNYLIKAIEKIINLVELAI